MTKPVALIVDDEADLCKLMQMTLTKMGIDSDVAYNLEMAFELFENNSYNFCLTDLALPDGSGLELVKKVVASGENTPIAVITAHGTVDIAIEALKLGAFDFVNKPLELSRLRLLVESALKVATDNNNKDKANKTLAISPEDKLLSERLIGTSEPMQGLRTTIKKLARSQAPVFLWGESGTGKEVVAKLIHDLSPRREGSFVPVNCGAIPSELMESEFFGHKKGSFTGATTDKIGLFQQANGGTLFLDEVADLPLAMQVKLLRAIQEKTVRAIGDTKEIPVDIRILSATHKDLNKLVQLGAFRQDLFYRINVIMVKLPTLNERRGDIKLLTDHFLTLIAKDWGIELPTLTEEAVQALVKHDFEGNVRELRNLLERAVTMSENNTIDHLHLFGSNYQKTAPTASPYQDRQHQATLTISPASPVPPKPTVSTPISYSMGSNTSLSALKPLIEDESEFLKPEAKKSAPTLFELDDDEIDDEEVLILTPKTPINVKSIDIKGVVIPKEGLETYLQNQEKSIIAAALAQANQNKTKAAKLLGMSFRSLRYRMKKLEMQDDEEL